MRTTDFHYELPPEQIAQHPAEPRDSSRLMFYDRRTGKIIHDRFYKIEDYLKPGDTLVLNQTKVIPARIHGRKKLTGGKIEILLLNKVEAKAWEVLVGGKGMKAGVEVQFEQGIEGQIVEEQAGPKRVIRFNKAIESYLPEIGEMPLPPYIHESLNDPSEYQTVFARIAGSAAAPTAGLHFTQELLENLRSNDISLEYVTLHVGLDTFAPVKEEDPKDHQIHTEWCSISSKTADRLNHTRESDGRVIAVGTTSVRTLETAANQSIENGKIQAFEGYTDLFILPGYDFQVVDAMITNFHLPGSTLLMLVSAFVGRNEILSLYETAKREGYRFYSFGDAMLIV
ncbi:MAG: tRNA preQ1(34) S-adenosylmethionine ribosyltransferase-isomerase QueA [candidate division Zixibacteria bacterium]|nr:tRNA preQ1(34) S-adenosylmethionine ribosyltransferase-isomerase QueA [candidate division Zixibacteria bacterium]NIW46837.1 tRNA preQ1(34) S-adenosylmethionine ribosyltransferase-isomerase QueA [Gammaproteobacteria bacterium]NIR65733.1 tRNA preQ1(34) S-adenosylmethionine ribosyltransferase-isomerase QueA [candidate division Zixibacteria bacterium]NIS47418.1 tRNA preQ1(34) S-adenosylmethionine ribosyltransferase-isomerase QueA [candidate division Zixibacteria bacterium]NIU15516.1 tRNA preQ1(3